MGTRRADMSWQTTTRGLADRERERATSTPAAETGTVVGDGGAEEIGSGSGEDNGGAAEEMDQEGSGVGGLSGRVHPAGWETKTRAQKRKYWKRRRPSGKGQSGP